MDTKLYIARVYFTYNNGRGRRTAMRAYAIVGPPGALDATGGPLWREYYDRLAARVSTGSAFRNVSVTEISATPTDGMVEL